MIKPALGRSESDQEQQDRVSSPEVTPRRIAIVTVGSKGIGAAISERLAADGAAVSIWARDGGAAEGVAQKIRIRGGRAIALSVDVIDRDRIRAGVEEVHRHLGSPTILINNAGVAVFKPFLEISRTEWDYLLAVNLTGTWECCQAVVPHMVRTGWGRIVNISSSSIHSGVAKMSHYVAAKSGVVGLTKVLALELARQGITVNTIPPGFIETDPLRRGAEQGFYSLERQVARTPVGRMGRPEDIAAGCAFLVSEEASYITGQVLGINGGRHT
jgi:NAD(P)-dependent dehydrogenase (short-subunit alcohol dehydrogenase family)